MTEVDLTIIARREQVDQPWLWRLAKEFDVRVNLVKANIDTDYGWVHVRLIGAVEEIQRATAWLMTTGLHVEAHQRAVGASPAQ
jgi:ABC-type methionine transport system ATPase subunit